MPNRTGPRATGTSTVEPSNCIASEAMASVRTISACWRRGRNPEKTFGKNPSGFYFPAAIEAYRCLIEDDAQGGRTLAKAVETAMRLEQARRAREDKPVVPGQPPKPSTPRYAACNLGLVYDFIYNWMTPEQKKLFHDELVLLSAWADNYGTFNNAEASRSNWATFTYWVWDLMAIEGEPGFNDLKFLGLYRGWRNFFTYSFFDSGAAYEAEGKLLFGMDAVVAFDRVAPKYGLELLSQHPLVRAHYAKFTALSVLPTQDKYAIFDILGSMGGGLCTPQDLVVAHYLYPNDATIDFVYRTTVGDDYRTLPMPGHSWNNLITCGIFATSHHPEITPEKLNLPLSFFCGQRALMMTRSSWDKDATMLTMHVRGASGGHPYPDRNGIMLAAQGRTWVTIPGKDIGAVGLQHHAHRRGRANPHHPGSRGRLRRCPRGHVHDGRREVLLGLGLARRGKEQAGRRHQARRMWSTTTWTPAPRGNWWTCASTISRSPRAIARFTASRSSSPPTGWRRTASFRPTCGRSIPRC